MATEKVVFTEERTLLDTLYAKALDSQADHPVLGDAFAAGVVGRVDFDFSRTKVTPANAGLVALRSRHLDVWAAEFVADHPTAVVLHLGCGLDSRVNRIDPPATVRWYDVDRPDVIDKRRLACPPHPAARLIGTSVTEPGWLESVPADAPVLVIGEGLFMYLAEGDGKRLFGRITEHFTAGEIVFDAFSRAWIRLENLNRLVRAEGGVHWGVDDPAALGRELRLTCVSSVSVFALPETERLRRPYGAIFRLLAAIPATRRGVRLLRYRWGAQAGTTLTLPESERR